MGQPTRRGLIQSIAAAVVRLQDNPDAIPDEVHYDLTEADDSIWHVVTQTDHALARTARSKTAAATAEEATR